MPTLLFPLRGPMQAWGVSSNFVIRDTLKEPSKSGVIGLIAAAMGLSKNSDLSSLRSLNFGVRVDREGELMVDFHTAMDVLNAEGSVLRNAVLSNRYFLADACFLIGLEGELSLLKTILTALQAPKWLLFLGRKSMPLTEPPWFSPEIQSIFNEPLEDSLTNFPWIGLTTKKLQQDYKTIQEYDNFQLIETPKDKTNQNNTKRLRLQLEGEDGFSSIQDQPINFESRIFARRKVLSKLIDLPEFSIIPKEDKNVSLKDNDQPIL